MRHSGILLAALTAAAASSFAQGTVNFSTRVTGSVDARVTYTDGTPANGTVWGQLYTGSTPLGAPVPFRDNPVASQGYITIGGAVAVPGVMSLEFADIKLVAWHSAYGASYADAITRSAPFGGAGVGESLPVSVRVGGGTIPPLLLVGLQGFSMPVMTEPVLSELYTLYGVPGSGGLSVPEPGTVALGVLGGLVLMLRRRSRR